MFRQPHQIDVYSYRPKGLELLKEDFIGRERMFRGCSRNLFLPLSKGKLCSKLAFLLIIKAEEHPASLPSSCWHFTGYVAQLFLAPITGWFFFNLIFLVSFSVKMEAVYVTSVHISLGDSLLWPASFRSSWKNTALTMQIRLFIPAKLSTALTSLLVILWIHLLEKHKQHFLWTSIPALTAVKSSSWLLWAILGPPETKFL